MPGIVAQKSTDANEELQRSQTIQHEILSGYKIETEIDRKLILGIWEEVAAMPLQATSQQFESSSEEVS